MPEDEITHIRELFAKRNVAFGCAPALHCPPLDKATRNAISVVAPSFVACRDAIENLTCISNLASGRIGWRAEHDAVKRIVEKICTRCWRTGMSVYDAMAERNDASGFDLTDRVVEAYSDAEKNKAFIRENWPHSDLDPNTEIRRFTTVEHLRKMLRSKANYLASVLTWPDVYEGLSRSIKLEDQYHHAIDWSNIVTSFYGQCWTTAEFDSELLWNARCSKEKKNGVCIRSTFGKLVKSFLRGVGMGVLDENNGIARCGAVTYCEESEVFKKRKALAGLIQKSDGLALVSPSLLDCLMIKRMSYSDEKEVRLIVDGCPFRGNSPHFVDPRKFTFSSPGLNYVVEPTDFIDEILVDPRLQDCEASKVVDELQNDVNAYGWRSAGKSVRVAQSDLYKSDVLTATLCI